MKKTAPAETIVAGRSERMKEIYGLIDKVAPLDINILISGEAGCGKETLARLIHERSGRTGEFNILNPTLFGADIGCDDEFYAHTLDTVFRSKDGTLLIDDISDAALKMQSVLLKIMQEQEHAVKKSLDTAMNIRIVAATNRNIKELARQRRFRQDLCHRLDVISISLPPLRERREDIQALSEIFLKNKQEAIEGKKALAKDALELLSGYDWPGNVRELENVLTHSLLVSSGDEITISCLPAKVRRKNATAPKATVADELYKLARGFIESGVHSEQIIAYDEYLKFVETPLIKAALDMCMGNKSKAAKLISINRNTLNKKLTDYEIN